MTIKITIHKEMEFTSIAHAVAFLQTHNLLKNMTMDEYTALIQERLLQAEKVQFSCGGNHRVTFTKVPA